MKEFKINMELNKEIRINAKSIEEAINLAKEQFINEIKQSCFNINGLDIIPKNKVLTKSQLTTYKYTNTTTNNTLIEQILVDTLGENKANSLILSLSEMGYFIAISDNLNKGKYILVDGLAMQYSEMDYFNTIEDIIKYTIHSINYHIKEYYIDESRGKEMLLGII